MWRGGTSRSSQLKKDAGGLIVVAVDSDKNSQHALKWAADHLIAKGQTFHILHVRKKVTTVATPTGQQLPIENVRDEDAAAYLTQQDIQTKELLLPFQCFCSRRGLPWKEVVLEDSDVPKAIIDYLVHQSVDKLVLGASNRNAFTRTFKQADVPTSVSKLAPDFCSIYVISKGKISSIRPAPSPNKRPSTNQTNQKYENSGNQYQSAKSWEPWLRGPRRGSGAVPKVYNGMVEERVNARMGEEGQAAGYNPNLIHQSSVSSCPSPTTRSGFDQPFNSIAKLAQRGGDGGGPRMVAPLMIGREEQRYDDDDRRSFESNKSGSNAYESSYARCTPPLPQSTYGKGYSPPVSQEFAYGNAYSSPVSQEFPNYGNGYSPPVSREFPYGNGYSSPPVSQEFPYGNGYSPPVSQEFPYGSGYSPPVSQEFPYGTGYPPQHNSQESYRNGSSRRLNALYPSEFPPQEAERERRFSRVSNEQLLGGNRDAVQATTESMQKLDMTTRTGRGNNPMARGNPTTIHDGITAGVRYRRYSVEEIQMATNNFSESLKIGEGGYGPVFKSTLDHTLVAIKILHSDVTQGMRQFQQEVEVLSSIRHPNMVLLMGACPDNGALVYEFMSNGSLEDRLFRRDNTPPLSWRHRFRIAAEIATGLLFLHQNKPEPLVHRDLKPGNILLDHNLVSKIADVGLARLIPPSVADCVTQYRMTAAAGTFCYIDPEYQMTGMLGIKSDVYALGIILLQLVSGKPPMGLAKNMEDAIEMDRFEAMLDPSVPDWPVQEALLFAKLSLQCAELRRKDRPDLGTVVLPELNRLKALAAEPSARTNQLQHANTWHRQDAPGGHFGGNSFASNGGDPGRVFSTPAKNAVINA
ncbi:hypothetical protein H6P81_015016 [Aristolochia fimbriata]|uniref:RING-type E3 ubiquitin transferase n=1 Tax=Aristolochia fimbriata TaxID=158543 RepID=A0AAV7E5K6_ARIFI|nr:hypothetical protein H6P81_015016 [Aristolochia fimbriata]